MYRYSLKLILIGFFLSACSVDVQVPSPERQQELSLLLYTLGHDIPKSEADKLSNEIFNKTVQLGREFKLTSPPEFHNFLVNIGVRKKGLCYHWSDALYLYFVSKKYPHYSFRLVGANIGEYFSEHNAVVVTAKGKPVKSGILIDPWRHSGKLYFSKVNEDKKYEWIERKERITVSKR